MMTHNSSSSFLWEDSNIRQLMVEVPFRTASQNEFPQPFCHYKHKNLPIHQTPPIQAQTFRMILNELTNVKYLYIRNYAHGSELSIRVAAYPDSGQFVDVYSQQVHSKGVTLKKDLKTIDLGGLPCRVVEVKVSKGSRLSQSNISIAGIVSSRIEDCLGDEYFKMLVLNPLKILYTK